MYPPIVSQPTAPPMAMPQPQPPVVMAQPPPADPKMVNINQPTNVQNNNVTTGINLNVGGMFKGGAERKWHTSLCGCLMDLNSCCCVIWCPPCFLCYLYEMFNEGCCAAVLVPNALMALRLKLRTKEGIEGSILMDCCMSCCCTCCVMCQLKRENDHVLKRGGR